MFINCTAPVKIFAFMLKKKSPVNCFIIFLIKGAESKIYIKWVKSNNVVMAFYSCTDK